MARRRQHRFGRTRLDDGAAIHHDQPRRDVVDDGKIVADQHVGDAVAVRELPQQVQHLRLYGDVERRDRLVGDDQLWPRDEGAGDGDALTLPAGELMRVFLAIAALEPDRFERLDDTLRAGSGDRLVNARIKRLGDDAGNGLPRVERAVGVLEDRPESGRSSAMTRRASVDLPEPDSPTMPRLFPVSSTKLTLRKAATGSARRHGSERGRG